MRFAISPTRRPGLSAGLFPLFLLAVAWPALAGTQQMERALSFEGLRVVASGAGGPWSQILLPGSELMVSTGDPAVPSVRVRFPLPAGQNVTSVHLEILEETVERLDYPVVPYAGARSFEDHAAPTAEPDPETYARDGFFPSETVRLIAVLELSAGSRHAVIRVNPVRFQPTSGQLQWIRKARLVVELESGDRTALGVLARQRCDLTTKAEVLSAGGATGTVLLEEQGFPPEQIWSCEGSLVEYVIIVPPDADMVAEWQALADWKTDCGHPAVAITTDEIQDMYPSGVDLPEQIRCFLKDAYVHWGLRWALLGADVTLLPTRYVLSWGLYNLGLGTTVASDYYYACLDGTWDADADGVFGEAEYHTNEGGGDFVDFVPEIHVGRVSAKNAEQVRDFLDKYFIYVKTPPSDGYLDRGLLLGEVLFPIEWSRILNGAKNPDGFDCGADPCDEDHCRANKSGTLICTQDDNDGAEDCLAIEIILDEVGVTSSIRLDMLLERAEYWQVHPQKPHPLATVESQSNTLEYINNGYGFVFQAGHADRDRWAVGSGVKHQDRITISDLGQIQNGHGGHFFWSYAINCKSAAIDYDSFAELLLMLEGHGAIGNIATTHVNWPSKARTYAEDFFYYLFLEEGGTLGDGLFGAQASHAIADTVNAGHQQDRFLLFSYILLGDPGMMVWRSTPSEMELVFDNQVSLGLGMLTVSVGGGTEGTRVCVQKEGEVYAVGLTGADGSVEFPFWPKTEGSFQVTATAPGYLPKTATGSVVSPAGGPALVVREVEVVDDGQTESRGNGNGQIEVGETIGLRLTLANEGDGGADSVQIRLQTIASTPEQEGTPAGFIGFIDSTAVIESLAAGSEQACDAFLFSIAACPPEDAWGEGDMVRLPLALQLETSGQSLTRTLCFEVARPVLDVAMNQEGESGQENVAKVWLGLINKGKGTASHLMARMEDLEYLTAEPSELGIREIEPGDTALVGPLLLTYEPTYQSEAQFTFTVIDTFLEPDQILHMRTVDLQKPDPPDTLIVKGHASDDMLLYWSQAEDPGGGEVIGYKVLRAPMESGVWVEVSHGILQDHRYTMDIGLEMRTEYQYGVRSVDAGGNVGYPSEIVSAFTRPAMLEGWPRGLGISLSSSPLICELDHIVDGFGGIKYREIIFGGDGLYAFHGNGSEVVNGDDNMFTTGPFSAPEYEGDEFWAKAAVGDLDGDGMMELVAISKTNQYVGCWSRGGGSPNWTYDLSERISIAWNSPTLADLDKNGTLEVIFCAGEKDHEGLFVLDCNGRPFKTGTDGRLTDFGDRFLYQSPAVGYVDSNDDLDIVLLLRNRKSLRVVDGKTGEDVAGFEEGLKFSDLGASTDMRGKSAASLADVDGDGMDEIFMVLFDRLWCIEYEEDLFGQGEAVLVWEALLNDTFDKYDVEPEPVIGELNADYAGPEVALVESKGKLWVWNAITGEVVDGFPVQVGPGGSTKFGSSILANVDEDSRPEIVFPDDAKHIHAYTWEGKQAEGFPLPFSGLPLMQSLAAWDVDDDGYQNLVGQAKEDFRLYVYDLATVPFDPADNPWPMRHRDSVNSNRFTPEAAVGIRVALEEAHVDEQGRVHLAWSSSESVQAFFILRSGPDGGSAVLVGEVPGKGGSGVQHYMFENRPGVPGTYQYAIKAVLSNGHTFSGPRATVLVPVAGGIRLALHQAGTNPMLCGKSADVAFSIPGGAGSEVSTKLRVLDPQGRVVRVILDEPLPAGTHCLEWDGRDESGQLLSSGFYLMRLEATGRSVHRRLLMVK